MSIPVAPFNSGFAITKSDTVNFDNVTRGIFVGGAGNMSVLFADGVAATLIGCLAGHVYHVRAVRVNSTDTTATNMVGLY